MDNLKENMILGIGNPLLDITATVDQEFLARYGMHENDAILASEAHKNIYKDLVEHYKVSYTAGGSVQNSLRIVQWLLEKPKVATFFGCVGVDEYSKILETKAKGDGVNVQYQYTNKEPTGTCAVLVTSKHRSLCANLAAANCFTIDHIKIAANKKLIDTAQFYYVSGFFLTVNPPTALEVAKVALAHSRPFMMNLSAQFISIAFKEPLLQLLPYADLLFGNEMEAEAFADENKFGTKDLKQIALKICDMPKQNENFNRIVIITQGCDPVILAQNGEITEYPVGKIPESEMVDTNGAGDAFVGGFLSQYIMGQNLDVCVKCGIWAAGQIIRRMGLTFEGKANFTY